MSEHRTGIDRFKERYSAPRPITPAPVAPSSPRPMTPQSMGQLVKAERVIPTLGPRIGLGTEPKIKARRGRQAYKEECTHKIVISEELFEYIDQRQQHGEQAIEDTLRRLLGINKRTPVP